MLETVDKIYGGTKNLLNKIKQFRFYYLNDDILVDFSLLQSLLHRDFKSFFGINW